MLVWLDTTEVERRLGTPSRLRVEEELGRLEGIAAINTRKVAPVVATFLALTTDTPEHFEAWVVEGKV